MQFIQEVQNTLEDSVETTGIGLFTGEKVFVRINPAPENHGIVFQRIDQKQKEAIAEAKLPALLSYVKEGTRCTMLYAKEQCLYTVEHILSALQACNIDNAFIEIIGSELPAGDGSAKIYLDLLDRAGKRAQNTKRDYLSLREPLYFSQGETHLIALPSEEFRISYTLSYPHSEFVGSQYFSLLVNEKSYREEIALCRTFSLYEDLVPLWDKGLLKHAGLENGVVIKDNFVLNPDGLRYKNEMVRHKILDLIGDLSLIGKPLKAHIVAIRSGHMTNIAFARRILASSMKEAHA